MTDALPALSDKAWTRVQTLIDLTEARRSERRTLADAQVARNAAEAALAPFKAAPAWKSFVVEYELDAADEEILMFVLAPVASPKIAWYYRMLQSGDVTGLPGIELICELLDATPAEAVCYRNRLSCNAPLIRRGLLVWDQSAAYGPIRASHRTLQRLFGVEVSGNEVPGATLVRTDVGLDDVVCSDALRAQLKQFAAWPEHDRIVVENWGVTIDHGPVALFTGPSGTGKTMAAEAIARQAQRDLYRVDLGMLVSKYIGETEKNLNLLFDSARELDCVLLFDEADSLFGKRGEVKDAKDRYANMEVGHLLSRIERHLGMCILTTNLKEHIDTAFLRRIDVVMQFRLPETEERRALWQRYLGQPLLQHIQSAGANGTETDLGAIRDVLTELAEVPRLSGAQIANACRYAARRLAASHNESRLPPAHDCLVGIAEGVENELQKCGREVLRSSLGFLHSYLEKEAR